MLVLFFFSACWNALGTKDGRRRLRLMRFVGAHRLESRFLSLSQHHKKAPPCVRDYGNANLGGKGGHKTGAKKPPGFRRGAMWIGMPRATREETFTYCG